MIYKPILSSELTPELNMDFSKMSELISDIRRDIDSRFEDLIVKKLNEKGYNFHSKHQLYEFAKRCRIISYTHLDCKELWYEKEMICTWSNNYQFDFTNNKLNVNYNIL